MIADRLAAPRARGIALAAAFSVVAGGIAVASVPAIAAAVEEQAAGDAIAGTDAELITPLAESVPFTGSGFTPGNVLYVQVVDPNGDTNWSWNSTPWQVADDGTVSGALLRAGEWLPGAYEVTLFESETRSASFGFEVEAAAATQEPDATGTAPEATESTDPEFTDPEFTDPESTDPEPTALASILPQSSEPESTQPEASGVASPQQQATESAVADAPTSEPPLESIAAEVPSADEDEQRGEDDSEGDGTAEATATPEDDESQLPPSAEPQDELLPEPTARAVASSYSSADVSAAGVAYVLEGFEPEVPLELLLTLPDGTTATFASQEPIVPDADGGYSGSITYSGQWPIGTYVATVRTLAPAASSGAEPSAAAPARTATASAEPADSAPSTADPISTVAESSGDGVQSAEFAFTVVESAVTAPIGQETAPEASIAPTSATTTGGGTSTSGTTGTASSSSGLARTGVDDPFGAAGLGLLALVGGVALVAGGALLFRRRGPEASER